MTFRILFFASEKQNPEVLSGMQTSSAGMKSQLTASSQLGLKNRRAS